MRYLEVLNCIYGELFMHIPYTPSEAGFTNSSHTFLPLWTEFMCQDLQAVQHLRCFRWLETARVIQALETEGSEPSQGSLCTGKLMTWTWAQKSRWLCLSRGFGQDDLQGSLPTSPCNFCGAWWTPSWKATSTVFLLLRKLMVFWAMLPFRTQWRRL